MSPESESRPQFKGKDRRVSKEAYDGPDRRQDTRVYEILGELSSVAHDLQARSSTLVAMVDILQREVIRQDQEDAPSEQKEATLDALEATAQEIVNNPVVPTEGLEQALKKEGDQ